MGLAFRMWGASPNSVTMRDYFRIPYPVAEHIFLDLDGMVDGQSTVTPEMVADEIDYYLAEGE